MAPVDLPYLQIYTSSGKRFAYYRRAGQRIRLPDPAAVEFAAAYEGARAKVEADQARPRTLPFPQAAPGSLRALHEAYKASSSYLELGDDSRAAYARLLQPVVDQFASAPVAEVTRAWVLRRQAELIATPRTANYRLAIIRRLFSFGVEIGAMTANPASRVKPLRTGEGHRVWTDAEIATMTSAAAGDVALPVLLALHTAQRQGDVLRLLWSAYDGRVIRLIQAKTRAPMVIPVHPDLAAAMPKTRTHAVICTTASGRAWTSDWFKHRFAAVRAQLGLPADLHFHGLRHSAASRLAEAGASDAEIQAMTGHRTRAMVARYTAGARQEQLAAAGMARLPRKQR